MIMILILGLILFPSVVFSDVATDKYMVERPDGGVTVIYYVSGSKDSIEDVIKSYGLSGLPYQKVNASDIPATRIDRKYWKKSGNSMGIDTVKRQSDIDAKTAKEAEKDAVLTKLKISKDEFKKLVD